MNTESYAITSENDNLLFIFFSIGKNGIIPKLVAYDCVSENIYNLGFGDLNILTGNINDQSVSNNGDTVKVMASVINTLFLFFETRPNAEVTFKGSTKLRTRLYQRIIRDYGNQFHDQYLILGIEENKINPELVDFAKNYSEFRISKKNYETKVF